MGPYETKDTPLNENDVAAENKRAKTYLQPLIKKAFRRPVETEDLERIYQHYLDVRHDGGSYEQGIQAAIERS